MADAGKRKDVWDKVSTITPLILGLAVTGVAAFFTQIYNFRQLQLNQITALEKMRPLLTSEKAEDREFGYASFAALGYEDIAIRIIQIKKDQSGRPVLLELKKAGGTSQVQASATKALEALDEAKRLVNKLEYGDTRGLDAWMEKGGRLADELGLKTKLGRALISAEVISGGPARTKRIADAASKAVGGSPANGVDEKQWVNQYLEQMIATSSSLRKQFMEHRVREFKSLIEKDDWELRTYQTSPPNPVVQGTPAGGRP